MKPRNTPRAHTPVPIRRPTILLVEDHQSIREILLESLRAKLSARILEAGDLEEGMAIAERHHPELAIVDLALPGANGIELIRRLRRDNPTIRVLVYSSMLNIQVVRSVMQAGSHGFVNKSDSFASLRTAITAVLAGKMSFNAPFNALLREALLHPGPDNHISHLTPREREVLLLVAQSHTSKEVATKLSISVKTAENHRTNLMRKLGVHDIAALVRFTFRHNLIDPRLA